MYAPKSVESSAMPFGDDFATDFEEYMKLLLTRKSPVNFFNPDYKLYPNFEEVVSEGILLRQKLTSGDCIYKPAYFYA